MIDEGFAAYAGTLTEGEDTLLASMRAEAEEKGLPSIQVPGELGRLLQVLIAASGAKRVLEIGTLFGYSATMMARALPADGVITTLEVEPRHADLAEANFRRAGIADRVRVRRGPALDSLQALRGQHFDFVFIDADKPSYPAYLSAVKPLLHARSVVVADNIWRRGNVLDESDEAGRALARFNQQLASDPDFVTAYFPTRGGDDAASVSVARGRSVA